ncbi:MAG: hypothetical protein FWG84_03805 [Bacteroidales bacterium]|nr:hypothetical protein [Bacteroidales bacterium]
MKKVILILVAVIGFGMSVHAADPPTCKIKGAYGTVIVKGITLQVERQPTLNNETTTGTVKFTFSNSSKEKANVTYSLSVAGVQVVVNEDELINPAETKMEIPFTIKTSKKGLTKADVKITLSGADCEKN